MERSGHKSDQRDTVSESRGRSASQGKTVLSEKHSIMPRQMTAAKSNDGDKVRIYNHSANIIPGTQKSR